MVRDREAWRTAVQGAVESRIELVDWTAAIRTCVCICVWPVALLLWWNRDWHTVSLCHTSIEAWVDGLWFGIVFVEIHSSFWVICVSKKCSCSGFPARPMRDYFERAAVVKSGKLSKALLLTSPPSSSPLVSLYWPTYFLSTKRRWCLIEWPWEHLYLSCDLHMSL